MKRENPEDLYFDDRCPPDNGITVKTIEDFDARGMVCVYGRGDHFPELGCLHMDVWRDRKRRFLARFWSRAAGIDKLSYEILGITESRRPKPGPPFDCQWVPQCLRKAYHNWVEWEVAYRRHLSEMKRQRKHLS
jgi:hypothetical protein